MKSSNAIHLYTGTWYNSSYLEARSPLVEYKNTGTKQRINSTEVSIEADLVYEMLNKFLIEKQMPEKELAQALGIPITKLELLIAKKASFNLIDKITLPIIKLYCATKF